MWAPTNIFLIHTILCLDKVIFTYFKGRAGLEPEKPFPQTEPWSESLINNNHHHHQHQFISKEIIIIIRILITLTERSPSTRALSLSTDRPWKHPQHQHYIDTVVIFITISISIITFHGETLPAGQLWLFGPSTAPTLVFQWLDCKSFIFVFSLYLSCS